MPNVAGREFSYTPEGMAAADRYRQSQGMRYGGMMGFRPLGYQRGGDVRNLGRIQGSAAAGAGVASDVMAIFQGLVDVAQSGSVQDVAAYIETHRADLNAIMSILPPGQANFVRKTLSSFPAPQDMPPQIEQPPQSGFPEFRKALRDQEMLGEQDVVGSPNLPVIDTYQHDLENPAPRIPPGAVPGPFGGIMSIGRR